MDFHKIYRPLTAMPFSSGISYKETEPCEALRPYIRCFWGSAEPYWESGTGIPFYRLVTPDTCMDIIFNLDYTNNRIESRFCGIDDSAGRAAYPNNQKRLVSTFAVRFYAWSVVLFSEESARNVRNGSFEADRYFPKLRRKLEPLLFEMPGMEERIGAAQPILLEQLRTERENHIVRDAVAEILKRNGNLSMSALAGEIHTGSRQLERLFREYVGVTPKKLSSLVRYQTLWNDVWTKRKFCILDEVMKLGYADQPHLLNDFKQFHSVSLTEARRLALQDVVFLQERQD